MGQQGFWNVEALHQTAIKQKKSPSIICEGYVKVHLLIHTFLKTDAYPESFDHCVKKQPIFYESKKVEAY